MKQLVLKKMRKRSSLVKVTLGGIGQSPEAGTVCTFGQMLWLWNCPMVQMDGLGLSWMENWPPCTQVEVLRAVLTPLKIVVNFWKSYKGLVELCVQTLRLTRFLLKQAKN